jgi:CDP-diacylglycerol--glycerol-3-phosphate 3-phosphatidyltransferase
MALAAAILFALMGPALLPILICVAAGLLDLLDGWLARRTGQITRLGEHLDPLADKVLNTVIFLALAAFLANGWVTAMVLLLLLREWGITVLREWLQRKGRSLPADRLGKWKMLSQSLFGNAFLIWLNLIREIGLQRETLLPTLLVALGFILLLSYISAIRYLARELSA